MNKFIDSNVVVYAFTRNKLKSNCEKALMQENLIANVLVLLESYAKIATINKDIEYARRVIRTLLNLENLKIFDLDRNLFFEAIKRNEKLDLKISDLIHYTTVLLNNCSEIISYDKKHFGNLDIKRIEP
ncbi:PIN domain-containing protein [Candidatus Woesearchaeota archaeon]|nr:PIN domain-containing protein [Candidatus Woesearchaeota archaeon]